MPRYRCVRNKVYIVFNQTPYNTNLQNQNTGGLSTLARDDEMYESESKTVTSSLISMNIPSGAARLFMPIKFKELSLKDQLPHGAGAISALKTASYTPSPTSGVIRNPLKRKLIP